MMNIGLIQSIILLMTVTSNVFMNQNIVGISLIIDNMHLVVF